MRLARRLLPSLAALGVLLLLRQTGLSERLNLMAYDLATHLRAAPSGATTPVRIIGIDEEDLTRHGPLVPDSLLAAAVERLDRLGVRAIGLDMFCGQPVDAGWQRLRQLAITNPRLVSVYFDLDGKQAIPGTPPVRQAYADVYTDPQDGVVRRDLLHIQGQRDERQVSLPMRLFQLATGQSRHPEKLERELAAMASLHEGAGGYRPDTGVTAPVYLQRMLPFHQPGSFPSWSLRALLREPLSRERIQRWRNSIVLIGVVAPSSKDRFAVPFSAWRQGERRYDLAGVEIHAHRLAALLAAQAGRHLGIQAAPASVNAVLLLVGLAAGVGLGEGVGNLRRSVGLTAGGLVLGVAGMAAALAMGVWVDGTLPLFAFALLAAAGWTRRGSEQQIKSWRLERQSNHVQGLFSRFVSKNVAEELLDEDGTRAKKELQNITVLMSDLRGYSVLSKDHHPSTIVQVLNNYLEIMFDVIEAHDGTIDEVLGDGILVLFGAPHTRVDHAEAAMTCALMMQRAMEQVNQLNRQQDLPQLQMGIGLCTGDVIVGTIGSQRRAKYGVVGTTVNLAARIEALTIGGEIFAAESTVRAVRAPLRIDGEYCLDVKGAIQPLPIFSIGAISGRHNVALPSWNTNQQALTHPLEIHYWIIKDKCRPGLSSVAHVTHLTERDAWLAPKNDNLEPFMNVLISIPGINEEIYGKVRSQREGRQQILFTVIPAALHAFIRSLHTD